MADAHDVCKETLAANWPLVKELAEMLIERETIGRSELHELITKYRPETETTESVELQRLSSRGRGRPSPL